MCPLLRSLRALDWITQELLKKYKGQAPGNLAAQIEVPGQGWLLLEAIVQSAAYLTASSTRV